MGYLLLAVVVVGALLTAFLSRGRAAEPQALPDQGTHLPEACIAIVAETAVSALKGTPAGTSSTECDAFANVGPVYVGLRANGELKGSAWAMEESTFGSVARAVSIARDEITARDANTIDAIEVCVSHGYQLVAAIGGVRPPQNKDIGVLGVQVRKGKRTIRFAPTEMIARNLTFEKVAENARDALAETSGVEVVNTFQAYQMLVDVSTGTASQMFRGNTLVPFEEVTRENVLSLGDGMATWMRNNTQPDGTFNYKYWPSRGEYSEASNTIRRVLGVLALGRWARFTNDESLVALSRLNIEAMLTGVYREEEGLGCILDGDAVKLGAVGLAALAIMESPDRTRYAAQEAALRRTLDHLWNEDTGAFRTFLHPADRNDNQNFYPGEALLFWGSLYRESGDSELLRKIMKAFDYYRQWHRENRNPAFVPWHTQAYALVYLETRDNALRDFIFEMNDWLVTTQQWDDAPYPDMKGRFYDPDFKGYGPPHASSTGVYMEGLVAAFHVATAAGDVERAERYRTALLRGLRNIMQLQFRDSVDMFYISRRDNVTGGIRTTEHNNEIRVDNVAHNLLAVAGILQEAGIFNSD